MAKLIGDPFFHPKNRRLRLQLRDDSKFLQAFAFVNGKKHQKSMGTDHLPTAFRLADDWLKKLKRGATSHASSRLMEIPILAELFPSYQATLDSAKKRAYAAMKWSTIKPFWGAKMPTEITTQTFRDFYAWRRRTSKVDHLKNHTLHKDMMVVRQILRYAIEQGHIDHLPSIPKVGKIETNPRPWLTESEWSLLRDASARRIAEAAQDGHMRLASQRRDTDHFMRFMVDSMCRVDEVRSLRFRDCSVETTPQKRRILLAQVTGKRGTRDIVAGEDAARIYLARLKSAENNLDARIFDDEHHRDAFRELLKDAELHTDGQGNTRNFKSLRATAISLAVLDGGENPNLLMISRNAGTSAQMIDMFYSKRLTPKLWKDKLGASDRARQWEASRAASFSRRKKGKLAKNGGAR